MKIINARELPTEKEKIAKQARVDKSLETFVNSKAYTHIREWLENLFGPEHAKKRIKAMKGTTKNMDEFEKLAGRMFLEEDELEARVRSEIIERLDKYRRKP